jgi:hypothetical protein
MTARFPIVNINGLLQELPRGDTVADPVMPALGQIEGFTLANIAEVEAATKALRTVLRYPNGDNESVLQIGRYSMGFQTSHVATTTFTANSEILTLANLSPVIVGINEIILSVATAAVTVTRAGQCRFALQQILPINAMYGAAGFLQPSTAAGAGNQSMRTLQPPPSLIVGQSSTGVGGPPAFIGKLITSPTIAEVDAGADATVSTNLKPTSLLDRFAGTPIYLAPNTGLYLGSTFPAASASQTVNYAITIQWNEWSLRPPM